MAEAQAWTEPIEGPGLQVRAEEAMHVAALRYFEPGSAFAAAVREVIGVALPQPLEAARSPNGELTVAWRSPTETLLLTASAQRLSELEVRLANSPDGCLVDLSGGLKTLRATGERLAALFWRLGGTDSAPRPGEARRSRLAEVPVLALCLTPGEALLVVDRLYAEHLTGWIRETLLDLADL